MSSCSALQQTITFPSAKEIFITSGDGNIQKPYTPLGEFLYADNGIKLFFIPIKTINPEAILRKVITEKIKEAGGDGLINMRLNFIKGKFFSPDQLFLTGTIIKR